MGDTSKHLTYFRVENFKRFESFEMKDLGQFNLIVGDNNVGKTSVLEALLVCEPAWEFVNRLFYTLDERNVRKNLSYNDLSLFLFKRTIQINGILSITFEQDFLNGDNSDISLNFDESKRMLTVTGSAQLNFEHSFLEPVAINRNFDIPYVPFFKGHDHDLGNFYGFLQKNKSLKNQFIESLKTIIPDLENIELSFVQPLLFGQEAETSIIVYRNNDDYALPLAMFGDGTLKLFRLLAEIVLNRGKRLMIDEVDTGIYFNRFKQFWKVILQTAKDNDVQLFMTTHSAECIGFLKEVIDEDFPDIKGDVRNITLIENSKTKQVTAHTYSFEQFEHAINLGNEIRA